MPLPVTHMHMVPIINAVLREPELDPAGKGGRGTGVVNALQRQGERDEPMICSNTTISLVFPLCPWLHLIVSDVPDALAPDYVFKP